MCSEIYKDYIQRGLTVKTIWLTNLCLAFSNLSGWYQFINNSLITIRLLKKIALYSKRGLYSNCSNWSRDNDSFIMIHFIFSKSSWMEYWNWFENSLWIFWESNIITASKLSLKSKLWEPVEFSMLILWLWRNLKQLLVSVKLML